MVCSITNCLIAFVARTMVIAALFKSGLDIIMINKETPRAIVTRSHTLLTSVQNYIFIDQDILMRFIMQHASNIAYGYGALIIILCVMVAFNIRSSVKPLITLILGSILFFYVDCTQIKSCCLETLVLSVKKMVSVENLGHI